MEKTRFEPFAAGELRVLRMACYEAPVALEWNEHKGRYQPMNSEPPKVRKGRKSTKSKGENTQ